MKGTQLKAAVYNLTGDAQWDSTVTTKDLLVVNWIQLAIEELPVEAIESNQLPLAGVIAGEHIELPVDFAAIDHYEVYDESSGEMISHEPDDLVFTGDTQIIFPIDIDTGAMFYRPIPVMEDITDDVPINPLFFTALTYFMYAQYYYMQGEGDTEEHRMAENYMGRYERMKNQKNSLLLNKTADSDPVKTSDAMPSRSRRTGSDYYE